MIASAHGADDGDRTAQSGRAEGKVRASDALAIAFGIEPAALEAAVKAAIAQHLGITVEGFNAAQATVKAATQEKKGDRR